MENNQKVYETIIFNYEGEQYLGILGVLSTIIPDMYYIDLLDVYPRIKGFDIYSYKNQGIYLPNKHIIAKGKLKLKSKYPWTLPL